MFKFTYYVIGIADESDEYYLETISDDDKFYTKEEAEQELTKRLEDWGYTEGWERSDYDIAKITTLIERD